jgi:AcrR family transcriptional regulator
MSSSPQRLSSEDRRRQIMQVATELFARQGYNGTTTRQIAAEAQVNEAIIFRLFESKEELYWAILERKSESRAYRQTLVRDLNGPDDELTKFSAIAEEILRRREEDPDHTRLLLFSALENHKLSGKFFETYAAEYYETLAEYIRVRIKQGGFKPVDPMIAARTFVGMVTYHSLIRVLFGRIAHPELDCGEVGRQVASLWLGGIVASGKGIETSKKRSLVGFSVS